MGLTHLQCHTSTCSPKTSANTKQMPMKQLSRFGNHNINCPLKASLYTQTSSKDSPETPAVATETTMNVNSTHTASADTQGMNAAVPNTPIIGTGCGAHENKQNPQPKSKTTQPGVVPILSHYHANIVLKRTLIRVYSLSRHVNEAHDAEKGTIQCQLCGQR